ncbi:rRNA (guanine-N(2))-methyltransferase [Secundilactobacillus oryzae JCM 18671]|uniref:rRNA (Guanine-N(2))-methyltransferase n=1 Tax=Secundilactobacillus oryzae JCM 18671 TaxID=1291743 RepID=A0A081BIK4_9LACO|nr:class I SAM-dependent RNA methyltransferase [Secundilactobacillus oryzae]GAK47872.1 rRNA (guanine-N(2))-methyltransferase [Secundilactobacillus oryzae JCM 18671]
METFHLYAATAAGIEAIAGRELKDLGYQTQVENGRIKFDGTMEDIIKANLWLRTADRIKIIIAEFKATTFEELFDKVNALPWEHFMPMDAAFPVNGRSKNSKLHSVPDIQAISKKAIVNKLSAVYHRRTRLPETGATFPVEVAVRDDQVMVTLDTTGDSLFKRGYRQAKGAAPMKENMAAALIKLTSWWPDMPLVDPTCGSGTIPIEAALIGRNIAPGINRSFVCEDWHADYKEISQKLREEARTQENHEIDLDIYGSDIDGSMIEVAKVNANAAGVLHDIEFKQVAVQDFKTDKINGVIISNPPYGERMKDKEKVEVMYRQMGKAFKPLTSWSKYIITADLDFEQFYGERATKKRKLYNGALRTDYFQYWGHKIR